MHPKQNILIVDDETGVLDFLRSGLHTYSDRVDVRTATSGEEALQIIEELEIALIITDIRMPGMDGFELINNAKKINPDIRFMVMSGYGTDETIEKCQQYGAIDYLGKPFEFDKFVRKMFRSLKPPGGVWTGKLHGFQLTDALQLVHMVRNSQTIRVITEIGEKCLIHMKDGEVVHAELDNLEGEEAFYKIIALEGGEIESIILKEEVPTTIHRSLAALLLEGMRIKDEANESSLPPRSRSALHRLEVLPEEIIEAKKEREQSPSPPHGEFYKLIDEGFEYFRKGDFSLARDRWEKAVDIRPNDRALRFNLKKLKEMEKQSG